MKAWTVKELINILSKYPDDTAVAVNYDIFDPVIVNMRTWIDSNYPYDKPDIIFLSLE